MRRQVVSLLAGVLGLLVLAPPALADGGRIAGRVLGGPEGAVLADARVELHRFEPGTGGWQSQAVLRTDADGRYRFTGLTAGRYRVCAQSDAGIGSPNPEALYLPRCWRAAATVDSADEIVLDPASMAASASIRLPRRGQVRGHVTDPGSAPVTGGYAQAFWNESGRWVPGPYALFDDEGNYELRLDSGRVYRVCFYPWEGQGLANQCWNDVPTLPSADAIRGVGPNRVLGGIDAQLHTAGRIEGLIRGYPTGTQGSIEILALRRAGGGWWAAGWNVVEPWTSPNPFEINNLPPGTYRVCFSSQDFEFFPVFATECVGGTPTPDTGTAIEVTAGETTSGADVEVGSASTIRGRALGVDAPVPVQLLTASGEPIFERLTEANGTYGFSGLPDGSYRVAFNRVPGETRLAARYYRNKPEQLGSAARRRSISATGSSSRGSRPRSSAAGRSPAASSTAMGRA